MTQALGAIAIIVAAGAGTALLLRLVRKFFPR